jgi:diacylglycerol O-acyltransferase / wax synthase
VERLSGLDAFFLYLETPTQPLNVCCVLELDTSTVPGGYSYGRFRAALAKSAAAVPEFRMKLADNQLNVDHPVWVDDEKFQLERHLQHVGVPAPGGAASWPRSVVTSPGCRSTVIDRCGSCGSCRAARTVTR